ncbi:MAG: hypothetical protein WC096_01510 [Sphaerochaetaceae bacterium]
MSSDGWRFKDRRSVVVTICVIVSLLAAFSWAEYEMKKNALEEATSEVRFALDNVVTVMDQRFLYAEKLCKVIDEPDLTREVDASIAFYRSDSRNPSVMGRAYNNLDVALARLQRSVFQSPRYLEYQPYFEKLSDIEAELGKPVSDYETKARVYNATITQRGWGRRLAEKRRLVPMAFLSVSSALENRP